MGTTKEFTQKKDLGFEVSHVSRQVDSRCVPHLAAFQDDRDCMSAREDIKSASSNSNNDLDDEYYDASTIDTTTTDSDDDWQVPELMAGDSLQCGRDHVRSSGGSHFHEEDNTCGNRARTQVAAGAAPKQLEQCWWQPHSPHASTQCHAGNLGRQRQESSPEAGQTASQLHCMDIHEEWREWLGLQAQTQRNVISCAL